jgi:type IV pilus assembly protein PilM
MATGARSVWAIDIGSCSLKALRLQQSADRIEVTGLDYIEHPKILSVEGTSEEEKNQIIRASLATFVSRNVLGKDDVAVSVPGQTSFARFIKLPPVDPKKIPEIIKFESVQQIPFDINEVEWDWQMMPKPDNPEVEVGIFAIKNELISRYLDNFSAENLKVSLVQMSPMALYNYAQFDRSDLDNEDKKAVVLLEMGSADTNLVICTKFSVWQRCIPLGGNNFTKAIAEAFKLDFEKAEKLKRGAPVSKYARQIFHAMKPVFSDLAAEIQRSLGYFSGSHRGTSYTKLICLGGGFKLQGLAKYIQQSTQLVTVRPDAFEKLVPSAAVSNAKLHDNICDLATTYGLGLQALGLAKVNSNLLPKSIARRMMLARKSKFFIIAASVVLAASLIGLLKANIDLKRITSGSFDSKIQSARSVLNEARNVKSQLDEQLNRDTQYKDQIAKQMDVFKYREVIPLLNQTIFNCIPEEKELYEAYANGDVEKIKLVPRKDRKLIFITSLNINYADSVANASLETGRGVVGRMFEQQNMAGGGEVVEGQQADGKGFIVVIEGYTPYEKIGELLDPAGVYNTPEKWGIVTRMMNLNRFFDGNSPFELFNKGKIEHFRIEQGVIDVSVTDNSGRVPAGIGILETKVRGNVEEQTGPAGAARGGRADSGDSVLAEIVLVDPLTKEEMSKTFDLDSSGRKKFDNFGQPVYIERDRWFRIKAKFLWKDPALQAQAGM